MTEKKTLEKRDSSLLVQFQNESVLQRSSFRILEEEMYQTALSEIIKRDFFPDLLKMEQEEARGARETEEEEKVGEEETSISHSKVKEMMKKIKDDNLSLDQFQSTYTSEDNASFTDLLYQQNQRQREAYRWIWDNKNKIDSERVKEEKQRRMLLSSSKDSSVLTLDQRPAQPDAWHFNPINTLMFHPETDYSKPNLSLSQAEKSITYCATRISPEKLQHTSCTIKKPIEKQDEEPTVAGWSFVDDAPTPLPQTFTKKSQIKQQDTSEIPERTFKMPDIPAREILHHRITERINKKNRAKTPAAFFKEIPKFSSSPDVRKAMLSPGGRLLLAASGRHASSIRNDLKTPRMSLLNNASTDITPRAV